MVRGLSNIIRRAAIWLAAGAGLAALLYAAYGHWRIHAYDGMIDAAARAHNLPPALVRAVVRQESRFNHRCVGKAGEIGLMQVTPAAAADWAAGTGRTNFNKYELFKPEINLQAGAWYLSRARNYWGAKANPLPYALAEYNAGRSNAQRWAKQDRNDPNVFWNNITYPITRRYIRDIMQDYRRHDPQAAKPPASARRGGAPD